MAIILSFVANLGGYLDGVIDAINGIKEVFLVVIIYGSY
ncbi:VirB6 [Klebsiella pneumoniae]|uniref:VirB6 n=1 Tax=Klebsiella pneumoniae TaxID=573 RepID=A0A378ARU3_KLEPN|nr:VirB6 [Klebsiella pneumoniae]